MIFAKVFIVIVAIVALVEAGLAAANYGQFKPTQRYVASDIVRHVLEVGLCILAAYSIGWF